MNVYFKQIKADRILSISTIATLFFTFVNIVSVITLYQQLPHVLPLFNQMPWGEERLGTKEQLFIPIVFAVGIFCLNLFISMHIYKAIPLVARILSVTTMLIAFFVFLFIMQLTQLVL